jgi:alpha-L-rhamnosidase
MEKRAAWLVPLLVLVSCRESTPPDWGIEDLRVEHLEAPLGLDEPAPRFTWKLASEARGERQSAYRIVVSRSGETVWDSGKVSSSDTTLVPCEGKPLEARARYQVEVEAWNRAGSASATAESFWETGMLGEWSGRWIGFRTVESERTEESAPSAYLRRSFTLDAPVESARLYATALGLYEAHLNGTLVGEGVFTPGWTDYRRRIEYQTYDVTPLLRQGENVLEVVLGDGWYAGTIGWEQKRHHYGPYPLGLLAELHIEHENGERGLIATDDSWNASEGPIRASDFLMGETYDARFEPKGSFPASVLSPPEVELVGQHSPLVERIEEIPARSRTVPSPGVYVFDFGQNLVGFARLRVETEAGTRVEIRFAEILAPDGNLYTANLRTARSTDVFIAKGGGPEVFEPHFTFHGFRYAEIRGYPKEPALDALTAIVVHSATPETGVFETSSPLLNQLQRNIAWSQRGNFLSIPTDCPQRDERLGWMGDAQIFARTACFNADVASFFTKWLQDVRDAQSDEGAFSDVAPRIVVTTDGSPGWGDAGVIVPWTLYGCYGDERLLERHYEAMKKWVEHIRSANPDLIRKNELNNNYGDWVAIGSETSKELLATAFFAHDADLLARIARVLGKQDDSSSYQDLFERIRMAFVANFLDDEGRVLGDTQTGYVLALRFDLVPEKLREKAVSHLVRAIDEKGGHLSTGFLGVKHLLPALGEGGRFDVAYRLLLNDTFPSWGYEIRNGATTIWERWDGWTEEKGFQDPGMNSFNHYAFGSVGEWMYENVAGIDFDESAPANERIVIWPRPGGGLTHAQASYDSIRGRIESDWNLEGARFELTVTIPVGTDALVHVPGQVQDADGQAVLREEEGFTVFSVGSGRYRFSSRMSPQPERSASPQASREARSRGGGAPRL